MNLFKLTSISILNRKTFYAVLLLSLTLPLSLPYLTPWDGAPSIVQPAWATAAWGFAWFAAIAWLLFQGASIGDRWSSQGVLQYMKTLGTGRFSQLFQLWSSCMLFYSMIVAMAVTICLAFAMPGDDYEAKLWVQTNFQYLALILLAMGPLVLLAIALGTRINATAAYILTAGIAVYGLIGVTYFDFFLSQTGSAMFDLIYVLSPHYHLADLTDRLTFKLGALDATTFKNSCFYLAGLGTVISGFACLLYTDRK